MHVVIQGGGSWGTALAHVFAHNGHPTTILLRNEQQAYDITKLHRNTRYFPHLQLDTRISATTQNDIVMEADILVYASPFQRAEELLIPLLPKIKDTAYILNASKGIQENTARLMSDIIGGYTPHMLERYASLSGPSFAHEVLANKPTNLVLAGEKSTVDSIKKYLENEYIAITTSTDIKGTELVGAIKNIFAIAIGFADACFDSNNTRAALLTFALMETTHILEFFGAHSATLFTVAGVGDLVLTCTGHSSRNWQVGYGMGKGKTLSMIQNEMQSLAEGVYTTKALYDTLYQYNLHIPITHTMYTLLYTETPLHTIRSAFQNIILHDVTVPI